MRVLTCADCGKPLTTYEDYDPSPNVWLNADGPPCQSSAAKNATLKGIFEKIPKPFSALI